MSASSERWERLRALFDEARALPAGSRAAFLDAECTDNGLRAEVDALLRAYAALEGGAEVGFLELDAHRAATLLTPDGAVLAGEDPGPGDTLGRYRIERRLAHGGMGVVYLAYDARLDRPAALKLLPRHLSLDAAARRRFEEEARAASALDHPHIATVYDIGDAPDGRVFIAMAYYEGETLREEIERGPLPLPRALSLATQIADALAAAHRRGIVHRDVKPGNVIVTPDGVAKLVDFGIAKVSGSALTQPGATPGTVAYMSPEQTRGDEVDARTDLWALGVILYEMLTGERPFQGDQNDAVIFAIRHDESEPPNRIRPDVPPAVASVVARCLEKVPDRRYRDATGLLGALRALGPTGSARSQPGSGTAAARFGMVGLLVLVLAGIVFWPAWRAGDAPTEEATVASLAERRLAVLPLMNESPDPEDAYFSDALTDELVSSLSRLPRLRVIAHPSVPSSQDSDASMAHSGRALGAGALLTGRLRKSGDRVHLSLTLVEVASQEQLWTGDYDVHVGQMPALQRVIGEAMATALGLEPRVGAPRRLAHRTPESEATYVEYLKGRYFLGRHDVPSFASARDHFQRALDFDPTFAPAWSGLADAFVHLASIMGLSASEAYPRARAAAERALALDPELADAHAALATALAIHYWDRDAAERHFRRAIELDPSSARGYGAYAQHLRNLGRFDEALVAVGMAQELDPLSAFPHIEEAIILYMAGRHHEAIDKGQRLLAASPDLVLAHNGLALNYAQQGRYDEALAALDRTDRESEQVNTLAIRGVVLAMAGHGVEARRVLDRLDELARDQPVSVFHHASIYVSLGEHDAALALLEEGARERASYLQLLKVEPIFAPLRPDPRFRELLRRVGVEG